MLCNAFGQLHSQLNHTLSATLDTYNILKHCSWWTLIETLHSRVSLAARSLSPLRQYLSSRMHSPNWGWWTRFLFCDQKRKCIFTVIIINCSTINTLSDYLVGEFGGCTIWHKLLITIMTLNDSNPQWDQIPSTFVFVRVETTFPKPTTRLCCYNKEDVQLMVVAFRKYIFILQLPSQRIDDTGRGQISTRTQPAVSDGSRRTQNKQQLGQLCCIANGHPFEDRVAAVLCPCFSNTEFG